MTINFSKTWIKISIHILAWATVISFPYLINLNKNMLLTQLSGYDENQFQKINLINYFYCITIFYLNIFVFIPSFLYRKKYWLYALIFVFSFFIALTLRSIFSKLFLPHFDFNFARAIWLNTPTFLLAVTASIVFKLVSDKISEEKTNQKREQENMKTELSFLRSQINPHFIFNVLNNIVALVRLKSNELEPTIMKLSGLMQYMLYETDEEKVSIKTETGYLKAYIDLQKQRFEKKVEIETCINLDNELDEIEPMLLIPFIENAFKHGLGMIDNPQIIINLNTFNQVLTLSVKNKFNENSGEIKDSASGIGLTNVSRRLNLLYGKNHNLSIKKAEGWFDVFLTLKLTYD